MKGQGFMEFIMTYGWTILIVVIVALVLWYIGAFAGVGLPGVLNATQSTICEENEMVKAWDHCYEIKKDFVIRDCRIINTVQGKILKCEDV